jgi:hypothetical protein
LPALDRARGVALRVDGADIADGGVTARALDSASAVTLSVVAGSEPAALLVRALAEAKDTAAVGTA